MDLDQVLSALRRRERTGISVIVEHWPPFDGIMEQAIRTEAEWLRRSCRYLQSVL